MIEQVVFFNNWHFGDVHSNKEYVRQFLDEFVRRGIGCVYATVVPGRAINLPVECKNIYEYPHLTANPVSYFDEYSRTMYINTWIGHYLVMNSHNFASQVAMWQDISGRVAAASNGEIVIGLKSDTMQYVSEIDESLLFPVIIPEGIKILFCNDAPISGQSHNGDWAEAINKLASEYPDIKFVCTREIPVHHDNIIFTNDLTNRKEIVCDLPEIGHISEFCKIIITNSSGPGTFAMTRNNFLDNEKTIIAFVIGEGNTFWNGIEGVAAKTSWHNVFDDASVYQIIKDAINAQVFNYSS